MESSFYSNREVKRLGFQSIGNNVLISKKASFYGEKNISIGDNVRIDDFCIISGNIKIGSFVHIAAYSSIFAGDSPIVINDFVNISSRVSIYGKSDDYSGESLTSPLIPDKYKNIKDESVIIEKYVIIGTGSTILPGCTLFEGSAIGAMSLITSSTKEYTIWAGIPAIYLKKRKKEFKNLYDQFEKSIIKDYGSSTLRADREKEY